MNSIYCIGLHILIMKTQKTQLKMLNEMNPEALEFALKPENLKNVMRAFKANHNYEFDVPLHVISEVLEIIKSPIETTQSGLKKNPEAVLTKDAPSEVTHRESSPTYVFCAEVPAETATNEVAGAEADKYTSAK